MNKGPNKILQTLMGYWSSQVLAVAMHKEVFQALEASPLSYHELSQALGSTNSTLIRALLDSLVILEFLEIEGDQYILTEESRSFLCPSETRQCIVQSYRVFIDSKAPLFIETLNALKGIYLLDEGRLRSDDISMGMKELTEPVAHIVGKKIQSLAFDDITDLGGGSGIFSMVLSKYLPKAKFRQIDHSLANHHAKKEVIKNGVKNFETIDADVISYMKEAESTDLIICSHLVHYLEDTEITALFRHCAKALRRNGLLMIIDFVLVSGEVKGMFRTIFDFFLKVQSSKARIPKLEFLNETAINAGFDSPEILSLAPRPSNVLIYKIKDYD